MIEKSAIDRTCELIVKLCNNSLSEFDPHPDFYSKLRAIITEALTQERLKMFDRSVLRHAHLCGIKKLLDEGNIDEAYKVMDNYVESLRALEL